MGQCDKSLRLLVVDTDAAFRSELRSLKHAGIEVVLVEPSVLIGAAAHVSNRDVVVVCVETAASLARVADICKRPDAPPVIAIAAAGFEHKSLEHVLLLAEMRGATAALPKPIDAPELVMCASRILRRIQDTLLVADTGLQDLGVSISGT